MTPRIGIATAAALLLAAAPASADVTPAFTLQGKTVWNGAQTLLGGGVFTPPVVEGGWSAFAPVDDSTYWTVSDRGPNGQPTVNGATRRTFLAPGFTPTIYKVQVGATANTVLQRIPLHLKAGAVDPARAAVGGNANEITGLPQISTVAQGVAAGLPADSGAFTQAAARDEVPYAADGVTPLGTDPYGIDSETIAVDPRDGSFWIGDEYRPSLVHVAADGTVLNRIIPAGETVPGADNAVVATQPLLPRAFAYRKQNRGMEGGTLTKDGKTLFGMVQSSLETPAGHGDSRTLRMVRFDVSDSLHPVLTGEFVYRLNVPAASSGIKQTDLSNSDIFALDATHLLVDEHDNVTDVAGAGEKRVYAVDLTNATNILGSDDGENPQLEATNAAGVTPMAKTLWLDLNQFGYNHDKPEGIGLFPNGDLAVQDDNDFGFNQANDPQTAGPNDPPFKVTASGHTTELWRFHATNITGGGVTGTVPATLSLTLGGAATFGAFTPGVTKDYTASTTANVISTAGDAALTTSDPGHLANGTFTLPQPLRVEIAPATWSRPGLQRPGHDHVPPARQRHRRAAHRRLHQDAHLHAVDHDAVIPSRPAAATVAAAGLGALAIFTLAAAMSFGVCAASAARMHFPGETTEYRAARDALLAQEIELRRAMEAVAAARRALPPGGAVPEDYVFAGPDGPIRLSELFTPGKDSLAVYHFMFPRDPGDDRPGALDGPCPSCVALLDQLDGAVEHVEQRVNFAVIAHAPYAQLQAFAVERGWRELPLYSLAGNSFARDYGAETDDGAGRPMLNVFVRDGDTIRHFWGSELLSAPTEPGQDTRHVGTLEPMWNLFDLTPAGRGEDFEEQLDYHCH